MKELEEKLQPETNKVQQLEKVLELDTLKGEKPKNKLEQESDRVLELNKKLKESHKVQELATHADCQANVVELELELELEQELEGVRDSAAWSLASQQEKLARTVATMDTHNGQIADLKQDLNKRNEQVIGVVQKLKEIKESLAGQGRNPSPDLLVEEVGSIESLDWDYEGVLGQSRQFIEAGGGAGGGGKADWPAGGAEGGPGGRGEGAGDVPVPQHQAGRDLSGGGGRGEGGQGGLGAETGEVTHCHAGLRDGEQQDGGRLGLVVRVGQGCLQGQDGPQGGLRRGEQL